MNANKSLLVIWTLMSSLSMFSQIKEETLYFEEITSNTLSAYVPKGTRDKTVSFTDKGYVISGKMYKKELVSGSMIEITDTRNNMILKGEYSLAGSKPSVRGRLDYNCGGSISSIYGTFSVSNGKDGLVMKPGRADTLSVKEMQWDIWSGMWQGKSCVIARTHPGAFLYINTADKNWPYNEFRASIAEENLVLYGYENIKALLLLDTLQVEVSFRNGIRFTGNVAGKTAGGDDIAFTYLDGTKTYLPGRRISVAKEYDGQAVKYTFTAENDSSSVVLKEKYFLPMSADIDIDSLWFRSYYQRHSSDIYVKYVGGHNFYGNFKVEKGKPVNTVGTFTYSNGDKFIGNLSGKYYGGIPVEGKTIFSDGTLVEGNWLESYCLTDSQLNSLAEISHVPSLVRAKAILMSNANNYNRLVEKAEQSDRNGDLQNARNLYLQARKYSDRPEIDEKLKNLDNKIKRLQLVKRFGSKYADKIMAGVIEVGMTKEMVKQVLQDDTDFYRISKWTNYAGEQMETWEFDFEYGVEKAKRQLYEATVDDKDGESLSSTEKTAASLLSNLVMGTAGYLVPAMMGDMTEYKYLRFRNSVLVELKDSSTYDDMNNAKREALNSVMWFNLL